MPMPLAIPANKRMTYQRLKGKFGKNNSKVVMILNKVPSIRARHVKRWGTNIAINEPRK